MITVKQNAYIRKIEEHKNYSNIHKQILFALLNEKKYFTKDELLCFARFNQVTLDNSLNDLNQAGLITLEGWLVRLKDFEEFNKEICEELNCLDI